MPNYRVLFFSLLLAYIFAPALFDWMIAADGAWYRPFLIWIIIIITAFSINKLSKSS